MQFARPIRTTTTTATSTTIRRCFSAQPAAADRLKCVFEEYRVQSKLLEM